MFQTTHIEKYQVLQMQTQIRRLAFNLEYHKHK